MTHIKQILPDFNKDLYNGTANHPLQSWEWGEARKEMGTEIVRIGEFEKEGLKNVFLMTLHPIPKTPVKIGYIPRSVVPSEDVRHFLSTYGKEHNIIFIKFEPDQPKTPPLNPPLTKGGKQRGGVVRSKHPLFPNWTQTLDLTPPEEELLRNMKSKTRYNIRLAARKGVTVTEESNENGFEIFQQLYFETCARQKYYGHNKEYHQIVWNALKENIAHILIARYENTPLAAYELFLFNDTLYYPYGGSSEQHKNLMAANLIMWEAIRFGKQHRASSFDMWGSTGPDYDTSDPHSGFTRFKEGYGTEFVEMIGSYDLVLNPVLYKLYGAIYSIRNWMMTR
jgi:lipid II:glycine glycyltransferase (peptidoglycan interpeptide bridge formation enzyme)